MAVFITKCKRLCYTNQQLNKTLQIYMFIQRYIVYLYVLNINSLCYED